MLIFSLMACGNGVGRISKLSSQNDTSVQSTNMINTIGEINSDFIYISDFQITHCHTDLLQGQLNMINALMKRKTGFILNGGDLVEGLGTSNSCIKDPTDPSGQRKLPSGAVDYENFEAFHRPLFIKMGEDEGTSELEKWEAGRRKYFAVRGNHDRGPIRIESPLIYDNRSFTTESGLHIILLDISSADFLTDTKAFLEQDLNSPDSKNAKFNIVVFHEPPYTSHDGWGSSPSRAKIETEIEPILRLNQVDLVLNGHIHNYEKRIMNGIHYVISGGGGGAKQSIDGCDSSGDSTAWLKPQCLANKMHRHFIQFNLKENPLRLDVEVIGLNETLDYQSPQEYIIDRWTLYAFDPVFLTEYLYRTILLRSADTSRLSHYSGTLATGKWEVFDDVSKVLASSAEYRSQICTIGNTKYQSPIERLDNFYQAFLLRCPDQSGVQSYLPMIENGNEGQVVKILTNSIEFKRIRNRLMNEVPGLFPNTFNYDCASNRY